MKIDEIIYKKTQNKKCSFSGREKFKVRKIDRGAGNRTPCLSHAKRALYHIVLWAIPPWFGCSSDNKIIPNKSLEEGTVTVLYGSRCKQNVSKAPQGSETRRTARIPPQLCAIKVATFPIAALKSLNKGINSSAYLLGNEDSETHMISFISHLPLHSQFSSYFQNNHILPHFIFKVWVFSP